MYDKNGLVLSMPPLINGNLVLSGFCLDLGYIIRPYWLSVRESAISSDGYFVLLLKKSIFSVAVSM